MYISFRWWENTKKYHKMHRMENIGGIDGNSGAVLCVRIHLRSRSFTFYTSDLLKMTKQSGNHGN